MAGGSPQRMLFTFKVLLWRAWHLWGQYWDSLFYLEQSCSSVKLCILSHWKTGKHYTHITHTGCVFDGLQHAGAFTTWYVLKTVLKRLKWWFSKMVQAAITDISSMYFLCASININIARYGTCTHSHTDTDKTHKNILKHMHNHAHIMQIAVSPVSVITKLCGGYNRRMLSSVKSRGQS